jgi:hypothetical protein
MTHSAFDQAKWEQALLAEAKRDLVFVFNIAAGAFGGPRPVPTEAEIPVLLQRVATSLLAEGCVAGFGNASTKDISVPKELQVAPGRLAESVARFYESEPKKAKFLVFVHQANAANIRDA